MKYITVNTEELLAALKPSQFRPFKDAILKKEFKQYLNHIFKDKDRIYLPFEVENTVKVPIKIKDYLSDKGLEIVDYKAGIAKNEKGKLAKIGKALNKDEEGKQLLDLFNTSRSGVNKKDLLMIVISRHPYDIAGMSTGRGRDEPGDSKEGWGWSSCMNLRKGFNRQYVTKDIENGALIAYVIDSEDENINKPISRILLKQYINMDNQKDTILYPSNEIHGEKIEGFKEKLIDWLKTFQNMDGDYRLNPYLYQGNEQKMIENIIPSKNHVDKKVRIKYYNKYPDDEEAKEDEDADIRQGYYGMHKDDKQAKKDTDPVIRFLYYQNHTKDEDAKYDDHVDTKIQYYRYNPNDEDAKDDKEGMIRYLYYINHPNDKQAKDDENPIIVENYFKAHPEEKP